MPTLFFKICPILIVKDSIIQELFEAQKWQTTFLKALNKRKGLVVALLRPRKVDENFFIDFEAIS